MRQQLTQSDVPTRNEALLQVRPLLIYIAHRQDPDRLRRCGMDRDDLIQEAALIFLRKYEPGRCDHPKKFAGICVRSALYLQRRKEEAAERKHQRFAADVARGSVRNGEPATPAVEPEVADKLRAAVASLSPAMRQLLADRFGLGEQQPQTLQQLAGGLVSKEAIRQRVVVVLNRVRRAMSSTKKGRA